MGGTEWVAVIGAFSAATVAIVAALGSEVRRAVRLASEESRQRGCVLVEKLDTIHEQQTHPDLTALQGRLAEAYEQIARLEEQLARRGDG